MANLETQILRAQMMRNMPEWQREPAIRGGVRMGFVIDARRRFMGVPSVRDWCEQHRHLGPVTDPYCDGDVA